MGSMLFGMWILMALSGVFAYQSFLAVKAWFQLRRRRTEYSSLVRATKDDICGTHKWDNIKLALAGLPVDQYRVCTECGFVSTNHGSYKLNGPALTVYKNELKIRSDRVSRYKRVADKKQVETDLLMNTMIKQFYNQLDGDKQKQVELLQQFFRKSVMELDSLYAKLNKELDEEGKRG